MSKVIGIIAVSHQGAAIFYRHLAERLSTQHAGGGGAPAVALHGLAFSSYLAAMRDGRWEEVGAMLAESARALAEAGASFCVIPDNLAHHAAPYAEAESPIPFLSMIDLVAEAVSAAGAERVGIVGTRLVTGGSMYQSVLGLKGVTLLTPDEEESEALDGIIFKELIHGSAAEASRRRALAIVDRLGGRGCEGVILASSELPLIFSDSTAPLPVYDPIALLAEGAAREVAVV